RLPLDPRTYPRILDRVAALVANTELENTRRALAELPDRQALAPEQVAERCREKERHKQRLAALAAGNPEVGAAIEAAVRSFGGTAAEPASYVRRLQERIGAVTGRRGARALYLVVEKITASFEHLPSDWPVHGETGYRFANVVNRMLVDSATRARMDRVYRAFIDEPLEWRDVAYECQQLVLRRSLASELNVATNQLARIARADRRTRDFTYNGLRTALAEVIACFP